MSKHKTKDHHARWAHLRFGIIGPLLAAPPPKGELRAEIERLAAKQWQHPTTGAPIRFGFSTIETWLYRARDERTDPVAVLRRRVRKDCGLHPSLGPALREALIALYRDHRRWSYQLHYDNLAALCSEDAKLGPLPSYSTILRFMKAHGLVRRLVKGGSPGAERAQARLDAREVRSFEAEYVAGLWHADFHHGSRKVLLPDGAWLKPLLLGILDDHSRLCCHLQWYLAETAENFAHGLMQAIQKRGLCRALLIDNGGALTADEIKTGCQDLGIVHDTTLPHSPYQNGKQEHFWTQVEGRLLPMLERVHDLTLARLNEATQAWVEMEYNRAVHSEIGTTPAQRFLDAKSVARPSPSSEALRRAFTCKSTRTQRKSDGTISVEGVRFELPSRYRHLNRVAIRFAAWDLSHVLLIDERTDAVLCQILPVDKTKNADGQRRSLESVSAFGEQEALQRPAGEAGMAPLLRQLIARYAATGLPPAYLPKDEIDPRDAGPDAEGQVR